MMLRRRAQTSSSLFSLFAVLALSFWASAATDDSPQDPARQDHGHEEASGKGDKNMPQETIRSLEIEIDVLRTGEMEIEQEFILELVEGGSIQRGPILPYLTVYRGLGSLVLENRMSVLEVQRDGKPEPFRVDDHGGLIHLICGSENTFLAPGEHRYKVRLQCNGDWVYRDGMAYWSHSINETFQLFPIESLRFELRLPEGVEFSYSTPAFSGTKAESGLGYEITEEPGLFVFETTAPIGSQTHLFLNSGWESRTFATQSQWFEVMKQHPKLPLTGFIAIVLLGALIGLILRIARSHQVSPAPVRSAT